MTASILARVSSFTKGDWLITRETVFFDTLGEASDVVDRGAATQRLSCQAVSRCDRPPGAAGGGLCTGASGTCGLGFRRGFRHVRSNFFGFGGRRRACRAVGQSTGLRGWTKDTGRHFNDTGFHRRNDSAARPPPQRPRSPHRARANPPAYTVASTSPAYRRG